MIRLLRAVTCATLVATAACQDPAVDEPDVIGACADLFADDLLPTFELELRPADWQALLDDHARRIKGPYRPAQFRMGNEIVPDVRVRLRGRTQNWVSPKLQLQIAFNQVDRDRRFHGLRKITLDASPWDRSFLRERVALSALRDLGVPAACANNARLVVNGAYQGLYTSLEHADRGYLERIFARADGDLFAIDGETGQWELETNEDTGDLLRLNHYLAARDIPTLDRLADLDASVAEWAAEAMIPHAEGYWAGAGNFLLYDHPIRGFVTLPDDLDSAFFFADVAGSDLHQVDPLTYVFPRGGGRFAQLDAVLADPVWSQRFVDELGAALDAYDVTALHARTDRWAAQIADAVGTDPNRDFTPEAHAAAVQEIRDFVAARAAFVGSWRAGRR